MTATDVDDRSPHEQLLDAWLEWDQRPGSNWTAQAVVAARRLFADELGLTTVDVGRRMAAGRRAGRAHDTILDEIKASVAARIAHTTKAA